MTKHQQHTHPAGGHRAAEHGGHGHGWMMIACCIPMIVIAVALVVIGAASPGLLFAAVACTAMMALMMRGMDNSGAGQNEQDDHRRVGQSRRDQP